MRYAFLAVLTICTLSLLTGCGGGSGTTMTPPNTTTVQLKVVGGTPVAAAVQINGGTWTSLTLSGSTASFSVSSTTTPYAVAVFCPLPSSNTRVETIFEATAADTTTVTSGCPTVTSVPLTVNYNVSAIPGAQEAEVSVGDTISAYWSGANSAANISAVSAGVQDIGVAAYGPSPNTAATGVQIQRGINVTGAPITVPPMSLTDQTGSAPIAVNSVPAGYANTINAYYVTAGGASIPINGNNVPNYALVAAGDTIAGDYYLVQSQATNGGNTSLVESLQSFSSPQSPTLTLPGVMNYLGPTPAAYPTFNPSYSGFTITGKTGLIAALDWQTGGVTDIVFVYATTAFIGTSNQVAIPNLSAVSGFLAPPVGGTTVAWSVGAFSQTQPYFAFDLPNAPDNETAQYAIASGTYSEP